MVTEREDLLNYVYTKLSETPRLSQENIKKDGQPFRYRNGYFIIKEYLDDFLNGQYENRFLVMPGLRGVGKTTIIFQLYDYLINDKKIASDRVLYLSADELTVYLRSRIIEVVDVFIKDVHRTSPVKLEEPLFIFIDESHYDKDWSSTGKILYDQSKKIFMIFTGSSALDLEMNVDAARRTKKESIFPISFSEYLLLKHDILLPENASDTLINLIFNGDAPSLEAAAQKENDIRRNLLKLEKPLSIEWEDFLSCQGFAFGLDLKDIEIYERIFSMVERVIEKDVFSLKSFNTDSKSVISRILMFLALQKPGAASHTKLAKKLDISPTSVREILTVLEKTQLIFNIKPYGAAGKLIKKPWKYYFLSPSLKSAINFKFGRYDLNDRKIMGSLAENMVASTFFKMKETRNLPLGIFYPTEKGGVDFLLINSKDEIIPVEVGVGKKSEYQVTKAIEKYKSEYGILISNTTEKIIKNNKVIHIPLATFSFL